MTTQPPAPIAKLTTPQARMLRKLLDGRSPTEGLVGNARWFGMGQTLRTLRERGYLEVGRDVVTDEGLEALEAHEAAARLGALLGAW